MTKQAREVGAGDVVRISPPNESERFESVRDVWRGDNPSIVWIRFAGGECACCTEDTVLETQ